MDFLPPFCPLEACPSRTESRPFTWRKAGAYSRACDRRRIRRYTCLSCGRRFSEQTFRLDFRERKPQIDRFILHDFVSKVTHRQSARTLRVNRKTIEERLRRFAPAIREFHKATLARARASGGIRGRFAFDELETFENSRRLSPVTVPVMVERRTHYVLHAETAAMAARGRLNRREREKLAIREARHGKRRSGARAAIDRCFEHFAEHHDSRRLIELATDRKRAYRSATRRYIGHRLAAHVTESSKRTRNRSNPLFAINHTFAMMRDGISRLVRRSWGASKCRGRLLLHIWIWIGWRNYVRPITNLAPLTTPAMALYVMGRKLSDADLLRWRWPAKMLA